MLVVASVFVSVFVLFGVCVVVFCLVWFGLSCLVCFDMCGVVVCVVLGLCSFCV